MTKPNVSVAEFLAALRHLTEVAAEQEQLLATSRHEIEALPELTREALLPLLHSIEVLSLAMGNFIEHLRRIPTDLASVLALREAVIEYKASLDFLPPKQEIHSTFPASLLSPHRFRIHLLHHALDPQSPEVLAFYQRVLGLASSYAYYGAGMTGNSSIISQVWGFFDILLKFDPTTPEFPQLIDRLKTFQDCHLRGYNYLAAEAQFLMQIPMAYVAENDLGWWLADVDSIYWSQDIQLRNRLSHCPDPQNPLIRGILEDLTHSPNISEEQRAQVRSLLDPENPARC